MVVAAITDDVPKRMVLSNGDHGDVGHFNRERMQWLDFWTLDDGKDNPGFPDRERRVQVYFETPADGELTNAPLVTSDFPLPETHWSRFYLREGHRLLPGASPAGSPGGDTLTVAVGQGNDVDGIHYLLDFDQPTAICGPMCVSLWATCTTIDTDLYVLVADVDSHGTAQMLQRGLLRASHRALDEKRSVWGEVDGQRTLLRPRPTHRDIQPVVPAKPFQLDIEVFPVGHIFRDGHRLAVWISQPPLGDPVTRDGDRNPTYKYESAMPPGRVTILRSQEYPSSVLLPILPQLPPVGDAPPGPGQQAGIYVRR